MTSNVRRTLWLLISVFHALTSAVAQIRPSGFVFTGTVVDQRRTPVTDATVTLKRDSAGVIEQVRSRRALPGKMDWTNVSTHNQIVEVCF